MKLHASSSWALAALAALAALFLTACAPEKKAAALEQSVVSETKKLAITAIVEHPALDAVRQGVLDELKEQGFEQDKNLLVDFQSAQGNTANAAQIAKKFAGDNPDVILAISTPSAQSVLAATKTIPVVFSAVTDPVAAKLVPAWEQAGANISGVSDLLPLEPQIDLMAKIVPQMKNVGYVYSSGEVNSTVVLDELKEKLQARGINLVAAPAQRSSDVLTAARSLNGKVDIIYTSLDNNVVSQYESMYKAAVEMKRPLVAADTDSVARGAVAALGMNYYDIGRKTGVMIADVLKGNKKIADILPMRMETRDLFLSKKNAAALGIVLPEDLIKEAKEVQE